MNIENWIQLVGIFVGIIVFCVGLLQYRISQRWKRLEFVAAEIKEFLADTTVQNALVMLDWNEREIKFFEGKNGVLVNDDLIVKSIRTYDETFDDNETIIRDSFDELFGYLENFENYIQPGLVKYSEFHVYLKYWLNILTNEKSERKPKEFVKAVFSFLTDYKYYGVINLFTRYKNHSNNFNLN